MPNKTESRTKFIYKPVQEELTQVERNLRHIAQKGTGPISGLLDHVMDTTGKKIRPALTILASHFHPSHSNHPVTMATAVELLHIATLIHDDTVDNSPMRRGQTTASTLWGRNVAMLLGDFVFATSAACVCSTNNIRVVRHFSETIMKLSTGELLELFSAFDWRQTREDYFCRIYNKTASLFCTSAESGAILSGAPKRVVEALLSFGHNVGMAFQIVDDILDFHGTEKEVGKPVCNDLWQGTITLPALLLLERYPNDNPIKKLHLEDSRGDCIFRTLEMMRNSTILEDAYAVAQEYHDTAVAALQQLSDNRARKSLLQMATYVMERRR